MKEDAPSATAVLVARGVAFQSTHPEHHHLVDTRAGELSRRFVAAAGGRLRTGSRLLDRLLVRLQERIGVRGITLHHVLRKRRVEQLVRAAIGDNFRQLIVLGGGLDTLAIRLAGEVTAIEIDHPATQRLKRSVAGEVPGLEFLPVDLSRENLTAALARSATYRANQPAVFLVEGVFMYLSDADVRGVLRQMAARSARTRVIFTFMGPEKNFVDATWLADLWLRFVSEPPQWAIDPSHAGAFVREEGFDLLELSRDRDYHGQYRAARGEHIVVAEKA